MRQLRHPNLMRLLDASIEEAPTPEGPRRVAYMLFPLYEVGKLWYSVWQKARVHQQGMHANLERAPSGCLLALSHQLRGVPLKIF